MPSTELLLTCLALFVLLLALTARPYTAIVMLVLLLLAVLIASYVKQVYLGVPMTLADVWFFLMAPLQNVDLFRNYPWLGLALLALVALAAAVPWFGFRRESPLRWPRHRLWRGALRIALGVGAAVSLVLGLATAPASATVGDMDAWHAFQSMEATGELHGPIERLNVFLANREVFASMPSVHPQSRFPYTEANDTASPIEDVRPDILLVLEESTFDTRLIQKCKLAPCRPPLLEVPKVGTRSEQGPLLVHSSGGGTWLSEFALMSGFDWRAFGHGGAFAPVTLAPRLRRPLPEYLRGLGYRTIAIYPVDGNFLNAQQAYRSYGFEEFHAAADLNLPGNWFSVRDSMVFDRALQYSGVPAGDTRPLFVFVLTIRNHGPHGTHATPEVAPYPAMSKQLGHGLTDYLARLNDSSVDFLDLRQRWLSAARPRVIGWFGDHQPEIAWDFIDTLKDLTPERVPPNVTAAQYKYLTYYQLSSNFGPPGARVDRDATDIAFLGVRLLEFAGTPLDLGFQAARQTAAACRGQLFACTDRALVDDYLSYRIHDLQDIK
jgi:Sulfatase